MTMLSTRFRHRGHEASLERLEDLLNVHHTLCAFSAVFRSHDLVFLHRSFLTPPKHLLAPPWDGNLRGLFSGPNGRYRVDYALGYLDLVTLALQEHQEKWVVTRGAYKQLSGFSTYLHREWKRLTSGGIDFVHHPDLRFFGEEYLLTLDDFVGTAANHRYRPHRNIRPLCAALGDIDQTLELQQWLVSPDGAPRRRRVNANLVATAVHTVHNDPGTQSVALLAHSRHPSLLLYALSESLLLLQGRERPLLLFPPHIRAFFRETYGGTLTNFSFVNRKPQPLATRYSTDHHSGSLVPCEDVLLIDKNNPYSLQMLSPRTQKTLASLVHRTSAG